MRNVGYGLIGVGLLLLLVGLFTDTTVEAGGSDALTGMLSRVYNAGLMARRQLWIDLGQHSMLLGVLLVGFAKVADVVVEAHIVAERRLLEVADQLKKLQPKQ